MGEARRRHKQSGYPTMPVQEFRVPNGKLAITVEVGDEAPSTVIFEADKIADVAAQAQALLNHPPYASLVAGLGREFLRARRDGEDLSAVGIGVLWSALYHPQHGAAMRAAISRALRDHRKAHITWRLSEKGLGLAVAGGFVDLDAAMAVAPRNATVSFDLQPEDRETRQ